MVNEVLHLVVKNIDEFLDISNIIPVLETEIKNELNSIESGKLIKICDFAESKDDGVYLSKKETLRVNFVKKSRKNFKSIEENDFVELLAYSYVIRLLAYRDNTPFNAVREYNKKIDAIVKKYE